MPGTLERLIGEEKQYFVKLGDGKAYGPVVEKSLRRLAARSKLTASDRVARSKDGPWHAVPPMRDGIAFDAELRGGDAESTA
jgi:hypothetical protein